MFPNTTGLLDTNNTTKKKQICRYLLETKTTNKVFMQYVQTCDLVGLML